MGVERWRPTSSDFLHFSLFPQPLWPSMAKAIFSNTHLVPIKVCQNLNPAHCMNATKKYQMPTRDANCDDCKTFIKTISTAMQNSTGLQGNASAFFNGTDFCGAKTPP